MGSAPLALRRTPTEVLATLAGEPGVMLLAVPDPVRSTTLVGCRPVDELVIDPRTHDPFAAIDAFVRATPLLDTAAPFPLAGGVVACLAYELGAHVATGRTPHGTDGPLAVLRRYDPLLAFDHRDRTWRRIGRESAPWLSRAQEAPPTWMGPLGAGDLTASLDRVAYHRAVATIREYLRAGDVYQVNLTQPFTAPLAGPAWALFARLVARHPAPYAAFVDLGTRQVVANSPELFLRRRGDAVETRPIKGTRPRGADAVRDAALAAELASDAKERAEHVMIVDLERNDLGRVCRPGTVVVERFAAVTSQATVHHLESSVMGRLAPGVSWADLLRATFPGGSITGAPKRRAMEIIAEIEPQPRGIYTGALGLLDPRGHTELGLPIRTGVVEGGRLRFHAGGGIVIDSDAERELDECWLKTAAIRSALADDASLDRCSSG
jgi:para-aminobenzoate synthetase component 1